MTPNRFYIEDASKHDGQIVTVRGWVYNSRSSGKVKFLMLRDGTGLMQGILFKGECSESAFVEFDTGEIGDGGHGNDFNMNKRSGFWSTTRKSRGSQEGHRFCHALGREGFDLRARHTGSG